MIEAAGYAANRSLGGTDEQYAAELAQAREAGPRFRAEAGR